MDFRKHGATIKIFLFTLFPEFVLFAAALEQPILRLG